MKRLILFFILLIPAYALAKNNLNYLHTKGYKSDVHLAGTLYEGKAFLLRMAMASAMGFLSVEAWASFIILSMQMESRTA